MDNNDEVSMLDLKKAWNKIEESIVQSVNLNPEMGISETDEEDPGFDYISAHHKLNRIFTNVGSRSQSAEFGGNDAWLIVGNYPLKAPGESATLLFAGDDAYKNRDGFYDIFKRTLTQSGEYEDETVDSGEYEPILAKALNMRPMKEVDSSDEAIARRDRDEQPSGPIRKTIKLDGHIADQLGLEINNTGNTEWTDGYQGDGPFLPKEVEDFILKVAKNDSEEPFTVRFIKYGSSGPLEGRSAPIFVEYEQEPASTLHQWGGREA